MIMRDKWDKIDKIFNFIIKIGVVFGVLYIVCYSAITGLATAILQVEFIEKLCS